ncbi:rod shape-determining protein MreC [Ferrimonas balearica]|uniref:rod shape-determining protein MreC n=1 Tax=Ferrimonas balearica TaxID=44012 RepID=UPI001C991070|nr:rod shape-determining protein MreC [Ferrimonas balearica]MBY5922495.1 rod shape-determining protein MreC [Ferrimonas balearica]MBY5995479.1 rod shape-determining protein MreC [Ferrimonas balearica]
MKPFFLRGLSLQYRLLLAVLFCLALVLLNDKLAPARAMLTTLVSPIQYLAAMPSALLDNLSRNLATRQTLLAENDALHQQQLLISERLQRLEHLEQENQRLRTLLDSPTRQDSRRMVAEVMSVDQDPFKHLVLIDKGSRQGVYVGQPVLDGKGVVGQVVEVGQTTSRILLISDLTHAIPVRVARNDVRAVAHGSGRTDLLELSHVAMNTDIEVGDWLNTSGLGGRFPEGYPVARVTEVERTEGQTFAIVRAEPSADLDRLRYLLLLWTEEAPE